MPEQTGTDEDFGLDPEAFENTDDDEFALDSPSGEYFGDGEQEVPEEVPHA